MLAKLLEYYGYRHQSRRLMSIISKTGVEFVRNHGYTFENYLKTAPPFKTRLITWHEPSVVAADDAT